LEIVVTDQSEHDCVDLWGYYLEIWQILYVWNEIVMNVQEKLQKSIALLEQFKNGTLPDGVSDRDLWEALKVKQVGYIYWYLATVDEND